MGILTILYVIVSSGFAAGVLYIAPIVLAIDALSLIAGIYLWKGTNLGKTASLVVQIIQLPKIVSSAIIFAFSFGFDFFVHITSYGEFSNMGFEFRLLTDNQLFFGVQNAPAGIGVSITAFIAMAVLLNYWPNQDKPTKKETSPPSPDQYFSETDDTPESG